MFNFSSRRMYRLDKPLLKLGDWLVSKGQKRPRVPQTEAKMVAEKQNGWPIRGQGTPGSKVRIVESEQAMGVALPGATFIKLPRSDRTGQRWLAHVLVNNGLLSLEELPNVLGLSLRTVQRDQAAYQERQDSLYLVDRRHFNPGQSSVYRAGQHESELISKWVINLLQDRPNHGRHLEKQLEGQLDDRTIDRALGRLGLKAAEAAGVRQQVQTYLEKERQAAYWAGVEQRPLQVGSPSLPRIGWQRQISDCATLSLASLHLVANGAYEAAKGLLGKREGLISATRAWHTLLTHLVASRGNRLSQSKYLVWESLRGLMGGHLAGRSASFLRQWIVEVADQAQKEIAIQRSDGREESITQLRAYQEESVAQRVRRGLVKGQAIWLDCYVNAVSRRESIVRAWHGTKHWAVKAFRRNIAQDVETGQAVTCPLSPSDVTPLTVLKQVVNIINGGLDRAGVGYCLAHATVDRWWSVAEVLSDCLGENLGLLCWARATKTVAEALASIDEQDPEWKEIRQEVMNPESAQVEDRVVGYRLETELKVYELSNPVRVIVDWDGEPGGRKKVRLALGVAETSLETSAVCDQLRFRQRVEILIKLLHRRLQLPNFGGGEAIARPDERVCPSSVQALDKLETQRKSLTTRLRNAQTKCEQVENELEYLMADKKHQPTNSLGLSVQDLRSLSKRLRSQIARATNKIQQLQALIVWGKGQSPAPRRKPEYELDLTREAILTQLKLDIFAAHETLLDEFIELALKPVLLEEAQLQAAERLRLDKRSTAQGHVGEPLCTDAETLYQTKIANLERETILERLLNQPGCHLFHPGEHILITVAQPFPDRRMQAAYERYCFILNEKQIRVPIDEGEEWLLLFTYEKSSPSNDRFK